MFQFVNDFFSKNESVIQDVGSVCTEGALAMMRNRCGFPARMKQAGAQRGGQREHNAPGAELLGAHKSPNNAAITFSNTVHLLPKDRRFEHGGAKLVFVAGAIYLRYASGNGRFHTCKVFTLSFIIILRQESISYFCRDH